MKRLDFGELEDSNKFDFFEESFVRKLKFEEDQLKFIFIFNFFTIPIWRPDYYSDNFCSNDKQS